MPESQVTEPEQLAEELLQRVRQAMALTPPGEALPGRAAGADEMMVALLERADAHLARRRSELPALPDPIL